MLILYNYLSSGQYQLLYPTFVHPALEHYCLLKDRKQGGGRDDGGKLCFIWIAVRASIIEYKCIEKHNEVKNSQVEIFSCIHEKQLQFLPACVSSRQGR